MTPASVATLTHFAVPWLISACARSVACRWPSDQRQATNAYDRATLLLASLSLHTGHPVAGTMIGIATAGGTVSPAVRTVAVAAGEEMLWRHQPWWSVVPFAILHAPEHRRAWPYHLLTGSLFHLAARTGGIRFAITLHGLHNVALEWFRAATIPSATSHAADVSRPSASPSASWPLSP